MAKKWGNWENTGDALGEGGQGRVFRVRDRADTSGRTAVLKELKNPKRVDRFRREIEAFRRVPPHPNLIRVVDASTPGDEAVFYVMDEAGGSLADVILNFGDREMALSVFEGICSGAVHLHVHSLLHRDLKPANVLMIDGIPKLADLGLCLFDGNDRLTETDEAVGPRWFMAPELEGGRNPNVDARADVYSLGKILYYLLTGGTIFARERPYFGRNSLELMHGDERLRGFDNILRRCIAESPSERYASATELLAAFRAARERYSNHPLTTLLEKSGRHQDDAIVNGAQFLETLTPDESRELLKLHIESGSIPSGEALAWFANRPAQPYARELLAVILSDHDSIPEQTLDTLGLRLFRQREVWRHANATQWEEFEELAFRAAATGDIETLQTMAPRIDLQRMPRVVEQIHGHFDSLSADTQLRFLALTIQCEFPGKAQWFLERLPTFQDEVAIEAAYCGIFRFGSSQEIDSALTFATGFSTDIEIGAVGRAMVEYASLDVVNSVEKNANFDPRLRVLGRIRRGMDAEDNNLSAVREEFLQGNFDA